MIFIGCGKEKGEDRITEGKNNTDIVVNQTRTLLVEDYNNLNVEDLNKYVINVDFNPEEKTYKATQEVTYVNNENIELKEVYFHIYPNTFKTKETAPFLFDSFDEAYPKGFQPGFIEMTRMTLDNKEISNYTIQGEGSTILRIPLKKTLKPKEKLNIHMEYNVVIPPAQDRFGYGDKTFNFGNWYPIAAVYDKSGWNLDPYYNIGDPFYSDTSNYEVTIRAPKDIEIAASGNVLSEDIEEDSKVWKIEAKLMRDFAWVASRHFTKVEEEVDGTLVKVYFLDENEEENQFAAEASYNSMRIFNRVFGKYPYGQYSVVATSFPSGMEYPGIVFIGEKYYDRQFVGYLEIVIAHETGHQWWYGVVGNDEIDEAWLDESLTTYSEVVYAEENYGEEVAGSYYTNSVERGYRPAQTMSDSNEIVVKPLDEFNNWDDYGALAYNKGAMFINAIRERYGKEKLYKIFQEYYKEYRFLNATTEDFIRVCEEVTGAEIDDLVDKWLYDRD